MIRADVLERKSELGRLTHQACHFFDDGDLDMRTVPETVKPRLDAWAKFVSTECFIPDPKRIEVSSLGCVNGMHYGMRIDRAGMMRGHPAIVEIKTTATIMPAHGIQLAGYSLGLSLDHETTAQLSPMGRFIRWQRYVVQLREDSNFRLVPFKSLNDANVFQWALGITHWKLNEGMKIREIEE